MSKVQPPSPAEAIALLKEALVNNPINVDTRYVAEDLAHLRGAFPQDNDFAVALFAIAKYLTVLCRQRETPHPALHFQLDGWSRESFPSRPQAGSTADLRVVFRIVNDSIELLAFGHRHIPQSVYRTAHGRQK